MQKILPVIDLKGGVVVRGVAGRRDEYRPVESVLTDDPSPAAIATAFRRRLDCDDVYVADLDAIAGAELAWDDYQSIAACGLRMWIDAGAGDAERAGQLLRRDFADGPFHRVIVGLESLSSKDNLSAIVASIDPSRLVFSLDLNAGRPLAISPDWQTSSPLAIAADVVELGIRELIVLDLARVGVGKGTGTEELCAQIKERWPDVTLIGGGGVRSRGDVDRLCQSGLSRVLVASALHDGSIP